MTDLFHQWGGDLSASPSGDIATASDTDSTNQQILRALMTNPALNDAAGNPIASADYQDHPTWGAGLPRKIGGPLLIGPIRSLIKSIVFSFPTVSRTPVPVVDVEPFDGGASINIEYFNSVAGETETLAFDIGQ